LKNIFKEEINLDNNISDNCIFCKIVAREIPSDIIYEDDRILAFKDTHPVAPMHILVIPKRHISSADDIQDGDQELIGDIIFKASQIAKKLGYAGAYKLLNNCGKLGGQTVNHLHFHILGGFTKSII
jgi:histidine triad (HIT) family protein